MPRNQLNFKRVQESTADMNAYEIEDFIFQNELTEQEEAYCWGLADSKCKECGGTGEVKKMSLDSDSKQLVDDDVEKCVCN